MDEPVAFIYSGIIENKHVSHTDGADTCAEKSVESNCTLNTQK